MMTHQSLQTPFVPQHLHQFLDVLHSEQSKPSVVTHQLSKLQHPSQLSVAVINLRSLHVFNSGPQPSAW